MKNRWNDREARAFLRTYAREGRDLALRTYSARLIGQDAALVLHGGGNTSVKTLATGLTGEKIPVLHVKGSGWDLGSIEPAGHPAVKMDALLALRRLDRLSDEDMVNHLRTNMLDSRGPNPSVEALLHAFLPHKFIDHTHADAVLALLNQPDAEKRAEKWAGGRLGVVPYIMSGFQLAQATACAYKENPRVEGLLLLQHGIITFGDTARESYDRMIAWIGRAERSVARGRPSRWSPVRLPPTARRLTVEETANTLRGEMHRADPRGHMIVRHRTSPAIRRFVDSRQSESLSQQGPVTPDHIIRTKSYPVLLPAPEKNGRGLFPRSVHSALGRYVRSYRTYFRRQTRKKQIRRTPLDPLPRIALVPGLGLFAFAADAKAADVALDIYEHTIAVVGGASRVGRYTALSEDDLFDMEYWSLEQAKLGKVKELPFSRKIVWLSGAASGIGLASARLFAQGGAHVFLTDLDARALKGSLEELNLGKRAAGDVCDVTQARQVARSFARCSATFGGVDIIISNAGYAPTGPIDQVSDEVLRRSFEVNFFAHQNVARSAAQTFRRQGFGGTLLFNASKSAFNPGPGFGPYALPKAGVVALMRQYAIELGPLGVRCNAVNADRVNTSLYGNGLLQKRARARGLSVADYLRGNLLGQEVTPDDVARGFAHLTLSRRTTGAVLPVDGGNTAAFPR